MSSLGKLAIGVGGVDYRAGIDYERLRRDRLARTQAALKEAGLAAAILTRQENIRYATSLRGPFFEPQLRYALAFAEGDPIMYELGDMLETQRVHATWVKPEDWRFAYSVLQGIGGVDSATREGRRLADGIVADLKARGAFGERIGTDGLDPYSTQALRESGVELTNAQPAMLNARSIKTPDEVLCSRLAISIANAGYARVWETLRPGMRERDVAGKAFDALFQAGAETPSCGVRTGPHTFELYHVWNTDRVIEFGDLVYVNTCSTTFNNYKVCIYRNFIVGRKPNAREADWYKRCYDRVYSVIGEIKPGATTADAAKHFLPASTWGYEAEQRLLVAEVGHGIGMTYEQPVISRIFSFDYPQTFQPGMIIAVESREGEPGYGGVRLEEMVLVTETGCEVLTKWPSEEIVQVGSIVGG